MDIRPQRPEVRDDIVLRFDQDVREPLVAFKTHVCPLFEYKPGGQHGQAETADSRQDRGQDGDDPSLKQMSWTHSRGMPVLTWLDEYVNITSPIKKHATERTSRASGDRLIQIRTHQGTRWSGDRLYHMRITS